MKLYSIKFPVIFFFLMLAQCTLSQPYLQWASIYSGGNFSQDEGYAVTTDNNLNVYVTGTSRRYNDNYNYITIKYNSNGDTIWTRRYNKCYPGLGCVNYGVTIDLDNTGSVYVGGASSLIKYNGNGNLLWVIDSLGSVKLTINNNQYIYVAGGATNFNTSTVYCKTYKFDLNGVLIWSRLYGSNASNSTSQSRDMAIDFQGNILITGQRYNPNPPFDYDFIIIKYNSNGDSLWTRRYDGGFNKDDFGYGIAVDSFNNIFVTGKSYDINTTACYLTIKYNPSGDTLWTRRYNINASSAADIAIDRAGNVLVTGTTCNGGCYTTIKYTNAGSLMWSRSYLQNTTFAPSPNNIILDSLDNIYINVEGATPPDTSAIRVIKYDSSGNLVWTAYHHGGPGETSSAIALDRFSNLYATGIMNQKLITTKFSQSLTNIEPIGSNLPTQYELFQNYPNPFNPTTNISFSLPKGGKAKIIIYDVLGKIVKEIENEYKQAGYYEVAFDGSDYASGVYFYRIESGTFINSKKMVLVK